MSNPYASEASQPTLDAKVAGPRDLAIVLLLSAGVLVAGGYLGGLAVNHFGSMGTIVLWALGAAAGAIARKLIAPNRLCGTVLAVAVVIAFLIVCICWIHWNIQGAETWWTAIKMLPRFFRDFSLDALIGSLMTFFGAASAYRQAGIRYRYVAVMDA